MTLTLDEMARRDQENALRMGRVWDDIFSKLFGATAPTSAAGRPDEGMPCGPATGDGQNVAAVGIPKGPATATISKIVIRAIEGGRGRKIAENIYGEHGVNRRNQWGWIVENVKEYFGCDDNDVECVEGEEGDLVAVCGKIVAFTEIE